MVENSRQRPVEPTRDGASPPTPTPDHAGDLPSDGRDQQTPGTFLASGQEHLGTMLDTGSFTQLFTAAQQSGLLANADAIISVRDCEFRAARWQKAFDMIRVKIRGHITGFAGLLGSETGTPRVFGFGPTCRRRPKGPHSIITRRSFGGVRRSKGDK